MTQELVEAAGSWRTRAGLALALLLAALVGLFALQWRAQAVLPSTFAELDQTPNAGGSVNPGGTITYVITVQLNGTLPASSGLQADLQLPTGIVASSVTCTGPSLVPSVVDSSAPEVGCHWDDNGTDIPAGTYTATIQVVAPLSGTVPAPTDVEVCDDTNDNLDCDDQTGLDLLSVNDDGVPAGTEANDVGTIFVNGVSVTPTSATNNPGLPHTFTWNLPAGFTCGSDTNNNNNNVRNCSLADVTVTPATATVTSLVVSNSNLAAPSTVEVTITSTTPGTYTITLATRYEGDPQNGGDDQDTPDVSATKTYRTVAEALEGAIIRHVDVDTASEDAAVGGDLDGGSSQNTTDGSTAGGVLSIIDDEDDATGSAHVVCLLSPNLGADEQPFLTWVITPVAGSPSVNYDPLPDGKIVLNIQSDNATGQGPDDSEANCVRWRSANVGQQTIHVVYDPDGAGPLQAAAVSYDGVNGSQPLIKEWNTIDSTKIVSASGTVGSTLGANIGANTGELDNWRAAPTGECVRDSQVSATDADCSARPNVDGTTVVVSGSLITAGPKAGRLIAGSRTFIEYVFGQHTGYNGEVDGVEQTFTVSGQCGSVRIEDPVSGAVQIIDVNGTNPSSVTLLSSDMGIAFQILPNDNGSLSTMSSNADCRPGDRTIVTITSREDVQLRSDLDTAPTETITIEWRVGPPANKQPLLAWVGQRVILEHNWTQPDGQCPVSGGYVEYFRQAQSPGTFVASPELPDVTIEGNDRATDNNLDEPEWAEEECVSRVMYESQDPGEVDVTATAYDEDDQPTAEVDFLVYYMKFESVTTTIVPGSRAGHNSGAFSVSNPWSTSGDVTSRTSNVSADVLVRVRVKGWTTSANQSGRPAATGANGETLPAGRWVLPDDWRQLAGGAVAETTRPNWDIMFTPGRSGFDCTSGTPPVFNRTVCKAQNPLWLPPLSTLASHDGVAGPFSLLDGPFNDDGVAPSVSTEVFRDTWLPDRVIDEADAPMPPALVTVSLSGSGFLKPADKGDMYNANPFYVTHIPAEPWITQYNADGSGYLWNSWGSGVNSGPYDFWTDVAEAGAPVFSAPGADPAKTTPSSAKKPTGGYTFLRLYSDNHGEVMAWVNGDAGLTMEQCAPPTSNGVPANLVLIESGWYCEFGDKVGSSTVRAIADYPDKRKHFAIQSNAATIDWTWGGIKRVRVADGETPQFKYVIFEVTDRDGFCDDSPSLWPVLGERVEFVIDSGDGRIVGVSGGGTIGTLGRDATTTTIPTDGDDNGQLDPGARPTSDLGVCQAWIRVSNSLLTQTNVMVRAFDPEGTVLFDEVIDFTSTHTYTLSFRWTLVTWVGADNIPPADALRGQGANAGGTNIFDRVTAVYGWNAQSQSWLAFFPSGVSVPGANNLTALRTGEAYWIAITAPGPVSWTVIKDVD